MYKEPNCWRSCSVSILLKENLGNKTGSIRGNFLNSAFFDLYVKRTQISLDSSNYFSWAILCVISKMLWFISSFSFLENIQVFGSRFFLYQISVLDDVVYFCMPFFPTFIENYHQLFDVSIQICAVDWDSCCNMLIFRINKFT